MTVKQYKHTGTARLTKLGIVCAGDYTVMPCSSNDWNGQSIQAYDPSNIKELNTEIVW